MLSKLILLGSGGVALLTSAYVIEAPTNAAPAKAAATTAQTAPAIPVMAPTETHTVPLIVSPFVLPAPTPPPPPPPPTDPTGGIITIPPPPEPPAPAIAAGCASLTNPAWAAKGPVSLADTICTATQTCDSLLKPAGSADSFPTLTAGKSYYVTPRTDGVTLPDGVSGPAVVAVPADGSIPTTMDQVFAASCFQ